MSGKVGACAPAHVSKGKKTHWVKEFHFLDGSEVGGEYCSFRPTPAATPHCSKFQVMNQRRSSTAVKHYTVNELWQEFF